jgi:hypothetical protein
VPPASAERTGLLVIRVWIEPDGDDGFRARITRTLDVSARDETVTVAASPAEVTGVLVQWLEEFVGTQVTER